MNSPIRQVSCKSCGAGYCARGPQASCFRCGGPVEQTIASRRVEFRIGPLMILIAVIAALLGVMIALARIMAKEFMLLLPLLCVFSFAALMASARTLLGPYGPRGRPSTASDYFNFFGSTFSHAALLLTIPIGAVFGAYYGMRLGLEDRSGPRDPRLWRMGEAAGLAACLVSLFGIAVVFVRRYRAAISETPPDWVRCQLADAPTQHRRRA